MCLVSRTPHKWVNLVNQFANDPPWKPVSTYEIHIIKSLERVCPVAENPFSPQNTLIFPPKQQKRRHCLSLTTKVTTALD